ncbi:YjcZ family sporulation protein [[Anoxybacillus] calidus]|nr:YjcZ family sporulation protein [Anoxybacillus calidus]
MSSSGNNVAFIVMLFILFIIVGCTCMSY